MGSGSVQMIVPVEREVAAKMVLQAKWKQIVWNLTLCRAAALKYLHDHPGGKIAVKDLPSWDQVIKGIKPVDGEDYQSLIVEDGKPMKISTKTLGAVTSQESEFATFGLAPATSGN